MTPRGYCETVIRLMKEHHAWFSESIQLIASENSPSLAVREALMCDFGNRYAEGWPGERVYAGCRYIDQVEMLAIELATKLFRCKFVDVRPISGVIANLAIYTAFTSPGDTMMALSIPCGGHISMGKGEFGGTAGAVHGLKVEYFPFDYEEMNINVDATIKKIEKLVQEGARMKLAMFGASVFLFPHPVRELADFMHSVGMIINYDGAHVAGLIAGGEFQDPFGEGADTSTISTHKTLFGPQGGALMTSNEEFFEKMKRAVFPGLVSNHHLNLVAAKAIAFAEMMEYGAEYAKQVVRNARALAEALASEGISVLGEKNGYTRSHTIIVDITKYGGGGDFEKMLEEANIICNRNLLPWDIKQGRHYKNPGGLRFGVQEVTRLGMKESEMKEIASFIARVIVKGEDPRRVAADVKEFRKGFQTIHYAFTPHRAYEYLDLVKFGA